MMREEAQESRRERRKRFKQAQADARRADAQKVGSPKPEPRVSDLRQKRFGIRAGVEDGDALEMPDGTFYGYSATRDPRSFGPAAMKEKGAAARREEARQQAASESETED